MKYHELSTASRRLKRRVGRGIASGQGKTAGRGTKGQKSRAGYSKRPGFEGGQNPLMQRLPKLRGFSAPASPSAIVFTGQLDRFGGKTVDNQMLGEAGIIADSYASVKLIGKGEVTKKLVVKLQSASASAIKQIEKTGGRFEQVARPARPKAQKSESPTNDKAKRPAKA